MLLGGLVDGARSVLKNLSVGEKHNIGMSDGRSQTVEQDQVKSKWKFQKMKKKRMKLEITRILNSEVV